jgi:hypothetical protein
MLAAALALSLQLTPHGVHLIEDVPLAQPPAVPLEQMSRQQLRVEYRRLEDERPGVGLPITLTASGGVLVFGGVITMLYSALLSIALHIPATVFIVAGIVAVAGGALLALGIVTLIRTIHERRQYSEQMDDIQTQLDRMNGRDVPPRDNGDVPVPPPPPLIDPQPPPPPGAMLGAPSPTLVLARF